MLGRGLLVAMISLLSPLRCPASPLYRCDPRWKLAALFIALLTTACLQTLPAVAVALAGAGLLALLARLPPRAYLDRLKILLPGLLLFTIFLPFLGSPASSAQANAWQTSWSTFHFSLAGLRLAVLFILKAMA